MTKSLQVRIGYLYTVRPCCITWAVMAFSMRKRYSRYLVLVAILTLVLYTYREAISDGAFYQWQSYTTDLTNDGHFDWSKLPVRYPVSSVRPLPTGQPLKLPVVQHAFSAESSKAKIVREKRKSAVRDAFARGWFSYKAHAWMADELVSLVDGLGSYMSATRHGGRVRLAAKVLTRLQSRAVERITSAGGQRRW